MGPDLNRFYFIVLILKYARIFHLGDDDSSILGTANTRLSYKIRNNPSWRTICLVGPDSYIEIYLQVLETFDLASERLLRVYI